MRIVQLCQVLQTKEKGAEIGVCCMHPTSKGFFYLELKITKANKKNRLEKYKGLTLLLYSQNT